MVRLKKMNFECDNGFNVELKFTEKDLAALDSYYELICNQSKRRVLEVVLQMDNKEPIITKNDIFVYDTKDQPLFVEAVICGLGVEFRVSANDKVICQTNTYFDFVENY
jgi:hypothetical protein